MTASVVAKKAFNLQAERDKKAYFKAFAALMDFHQNRDYLQCLRLNNISADGVFYHLNKLSFKQIKVCFDKGIQDSLIKAKKYRLTAATIAIDINDIPYYGEIEGILVHNTKDGKVLREITVHIVVNGYRFTIFAIPVSVFDITH